MDEERLTALCPSNASSLWTVLKVSLSSNFEARVSGVRVVEDSKNSLKNPPANNPTKKQNRSIKVRKVQARRVQRVRK